MRLVLCLLNLSVPTVFPFYARFTEIFFKLLNPKKRLLVAPFKGTDEASKRTERSSGTP